MNVVEVNTLLLFRSPGYLIILMRVSTVIYNCLKCSKR